MHSPVAFAVRLCATAQESSSSSHFEARAIIMWAVCFIPTVPSLASCALRFSSFSCIRIRFWLSRSIPLWSLFSIFPRNSTAPATASAQRFASASVSASKANSLSVDSFFWPNQPPSFGACPVHRRHRVLPSTDSAADGGDAGSDRIGMLTTCLGRFSDCSRLCHWSCALFSESFNHPGAFLPIFLKAAPSKSSGNVAFSKWVSLSILWEHCQQVRWDNPKLRTSRASRPGPGSA